MILRFFWLRSAVGMILLMFLRTSDGPSIPGKKRRRRPVEWPSSYAFIRILSELCGCRRNASVILRVPLPPEKSTTLICARATCFAASLPATAGMTLAFIARMGPPQELFQAGGVSWRVHADGLFHAHQARCQDHSITGRQRNHG